ncbi:MDR family MFS transporter [Bifidobacterium choloepi]|uniref:Multidrug efflux MFS transporter n=1 Tax=Bifidobacterium choloepi TaxID=2614131 RepID=A0A6I5NCE3_9BIFI|nr:MDR family MFS transporter [Bifidobacterium choloepi]NEG70200.1 multidrug efflux MFS transporter [Bifidobacterium choloepi]
MKQEEFILDNSNPELVAESAADLEDGVENRLEEEEQLIQDEWGAPVAEADGDQTIPKRLIGSIAAVGSLAFLGILTETLMTVLFPALMEEFNISTSLVQWVTTIYLLSVAATMPLSGFLNRRFTLKSLFVAAVALAVIGSVIMIFGYRFWLVLVARCLQGIGSGIATPLMMNIILEQSPKTKIGRLMGVGALVITVAPAIGPTVGGAVSAVWPWRTVFMIVVPILVLVSLPLGLHCIEQKRPTEAAHLNAVQFVAVVVALVGLLFGVNELGVAISDGVSGAPAAGSIVAAVASLVIGLASLVFFCWSARKSFSPLIRLGWLRDRVNLLHVVAYALLPLLSFGFGYVITNLAQLSLGTDALIAGLLMMPGALVGALCAPLGGMMYDRFGAVKPIVGSLIACGVGLVLLFVFSAHLTPFTLAAFFFLFGVGYALCISNIMTSGMSGIPGPFMPDGNAVFNTVMQFGGAAGITLFSTIMAICQAGHGTIGSAAYVRATTSGGTWIFLTMLVVFAVAFACLLTAFRLRRARLAKAGTDKSAR